MEDQQTFSIYINPNNYVLKILKHNFLPNPCLLLQNHFHKWNWYLQKLRKEKQNITKKKKKKKKKENLQLLFSEREPAI